jgi:hypothetical protein
MRRLCEGGPEGGEVLRVRVQRLLGRGTYSEVYVGVHAASGALAALKVDKPQAGSRPVSRRTGDKRRAPKAAPPTPPCAGHTP